MLIVRYSREVEAKVVDPKVAARRLVEAADKGRTDFIVALHDTMRAFGLHRVVGDE